MPKVLQIIDSLTVGGAESLLVSIANEYTDGEMHIISLADKTPLAEKLNPSIKLTRLGFRKKTDIPRCVFFIRRYIKKHNIEIVQAHLVLAGMIAKLACPAKVPLFITLHNLNANRIFAKGRSLNKFMERVTYRKRHNIIAVSKTVLDEYATVVGLKGNAWVLYNFVQDHFFVQEPKQWKDRSQLKMIAIGSFKRQKNYTFLADAMRSVPAGVTLDIYGAGEEFDLVKEKIEAQNLPIRLMGVNSNVAGLFKDYDIFVMSSLFEGHPIALLEAMASGMPAILPDLPVFKEVTEGKGIFYKPGDENSFREKIQEILDGRTDIDEYARLNLSFASRIGRKEHYLASLAGLYQRVAPKS